MFGDLTLPQKLPDVVTHFLSTYFYRKLKFRKEGKIAFSVAALKPTRLVVQLEEKGGGKYLALLNVPGENEIRDIVLGFAEFQAASDSRDANNRLDPEQILRVYFMDITGIQDKVTEETSLFINNIRAIAP